MGLGPLRSEFRCLFSSSSMRSDIRFASASARNLSALWPSVSLGGGAIARVSGSSEDMTTGTIRGLGRDDMVGGDEGVLGAVSVLAARKMARGRWWMKLGEGWCSYDMRRGNRDTGGHRRRIDDFHICLRISATNRAERASRFLESPADEKEHGKAK